MREGQRDPAGADAELERRPVAGESSQEVDDRVNDGRVKHRGRRLVVPLSNLLAEVVLGHPGILADLPHTHPWR